MTDAEKREKVVEGLKELQSHSRAMAGISSSKQGRESHIESARTIGEAIALLKAQEPRVMTLEEVKALPDESDVWLEEFCSIVVATTISHQPTIYKVLKRFNPDATYFYGIEHADYNSGEYMDADYGTEWRCWTSRPTDEQREATPWN